MLTEKVPSYLCMKNVLSSRKVCVHFDRLRFQYQVNTAKLGQFLYLANCYVIKVALDNDDDLIDTAP